MQGMIHNPPLTIEQDEGVTVSNRRTLNFVGPGITAVDDPANARANITISTAAAGTIQPDDAAQEGVADDLARADHQHAIDAAAPSGPTGDADSEGVATSFARSDHDHEVGFVVIDFALAGGDHTWSGAFGTVTVGENVVFGEGLYLKNDEKYWKHDADQNTTMPCVCIALEDKNADQTCKVLLWGTIRDDSWAWTVGSGEANLMFAHTTAGDFVQFAAKPAGSGDYVQVCGYCYHEHKMYFWPSFEMVKVA